MCASLLDRPLSEVTKDRKSGLSTSNNFDSRSDPLANTGVRSLSLRVQLLLVVNVPLVVLVTLFLAYDFRREMSDRVVEKKIALDEEAKTMLPVVLQMRHHGNDRVQSYIDTVCARMQDNESPGHHIVVVSPETVMQAEAHHRSSTGMVQAVQWAVQSPLRRTHIGEHEIIVGNYGQDGTNVGSNSSSARPW